MANKEITPTDADKFWDYLHSEYPEISNQLSNRALISGAIASFQPAKMSNEDYAEYQKILYTWQIDNGFWDEIMLITADQKQILFLRDSLKSVNPIDNFSCEIEIKEDIDTISKFVINENSEALKKRLYI